MRWLVVFFDQVLGDSSQILHSDTYSNYAMSPIIYLKMWPLENKYETKKCLSGLILQSTF